MLGDVGSRRAVNDDSDPVRSCTSSAFGCISASECMPPFQSPYRDADYRSTNAEDDAVPDPASREGNSLRRCYA